MSNLDESRFAKESFLLECKSRAILIRAKEGGCSSILVAMQKNLPSSPFSHLLFYLERIILIIIFPLWGKFIFRLI